MTGLKKPSPEEVADFVNAAADAKMDIVAGFLKKFPDAVDERHNGRTALMMAADYHYENIAKVLLEHNASLDEKTSDGRTPMDLAQEWGSYFVADLLEREAESRRQKSLAAQAVEEERIRQVSDPCLHRDLPVRGKSLGYKGP